MHFQIIRKNKVLPFTSKRSQLLLHKLSLLRIRGDNSQVKETIVHKVSNKSSDVEFGRVWEGFFADGGQLVGGRG